MTDQARQFCRKAKAVRIHCPVDRETVEALLRGDMKVVEDHPLIARMLGIIRGPNALGNFGLYRGVVEISAGIESFIPLPEAKPALGEAGLASTSPTLILTSYVAAEVAEAELASLLEELLKAHPWEVPVIELQPIDLAVR